MGYLWALQRHKVNYLISTPYYVNYTMLMWTVLALRESSANFFLRVVGEI